ncbi:MAG: hypothetical protein KGJ43_01510 [Acidobacteriota bacterium]|nr:hypothetical protein [Acidobacteriota bacterium]
MMRVDHVVAELELDPLDRNLNFLQLLDERRFVCLWDGDLLSSAREGRSLKL